MWLKIKAWTKAIVFLIVLVYVALFVFKNGDQNVQFWWWFGHHREIDAIFLALGSFVAGAVCWIFMATTWRTVRQIRGARTERVERVVQVPATTAPGVIRVDDLGTAK